MLHDIVTKGSTDRSVTVRIIDSSDGTPETGVVYNTSGIDLWYRREGAAKTSITEATLAALTTAHTDGGFLHVGDGVYRLDLPDAAFATGAEYVDFGGTVTGMVVIGGRVRLVDVDLEDAVRGGMTALPNAAADAAGGLAISDAGGLDLDTKLGYLTAATATASALSTAQADLDILTGTDGVTLATSQPNYAPATAAALTTHDGKLDTVDANVDAILLDTGTDGVVVAAASKTGYSLTATTGLGNQTANITGNLSGSVGSVTGAVGSVTGNVGGNVVGSVASVTGAVGSVTGAVGSVTGTVGGVAGTIQTLDALDTAQDTQHAQTQTDIAALNDPTAAAIADAVWDEAKASHVGAGSFGEEVQAHALSTEISALNDLDAAAVRTAIGLATANLDTQIATLATAAALTTVDTVVDGIKAVTDVLPDSGALTSLATAAALATVDGIVDSIKTVTDALTAAAAAKLALSTAGIVSGAAVSGTLSTTEMTTDLTEATDGHYIGGVVVWTSGVLAGQRTDITAYDGTTKKLTFTGVTEAPGAGDAFVIV